MTSSWLSARPRGELMTQGADQAQTEDGLADLVKGAQDGDTASFARLYEHFYARIFRYVSFKTGNASEAEDITEDVFLRMLESISTFRFRGPPFSSWLFRIAHNLVVDHFRKKGREKLAPLEDSFGVRGAPSSDMDRELDIQIRMTEVRRAMTGLTDLQREVIVLRFAGGLSINETARAVGKRVNAVKALQHAGIRGLRRRMGVDRAGSGTALAAGPGDAANG